MGQLSKKTGLEVFAEQFADSPQLLSFVEANFGGEALANIRQDLLDSADASGFSLRHWVESLRTLRAWLDARNLVMPIEDELGYVRCAGEAAGTGTNLTYLPGLVTDMLETYGCERAEPPGTDEVDPAGDD